MRKVALNKGGSVKTLIATTLTAWLIATVSYGQDFLATAEDTLNINAATSGWTITTDAIGWDAIDDSVWYDDAYGIVKHDTTREYVSAIEDKCDSAYTKKWVPYEKIKGVQYFKRMAVIDSVHCYVDSTWAKKQPIYLTPDEMDELRRLLRCGR